MAVMIGGKVAKESWSLSTRNRQEGREVVVPLKPVRRENSPGRLRRNCSMPNFGEIVENLIQKRWRNCDEKTGTASRSYWLRV